VFVREHKWGKISPLVETVALFGTSAITALIAASCASGKAANFILPPALIAKHMVTTTIMENVSQPL